LSVLYSLSRLGDQSCALVDELREQRRKK
jgi:hypothetical protein